MRWSLTLTVKLRQVATQALAAIPERGLLYCQRPDQDNWCTMASGACTAPSYPGPTRSPLLPPAQHTHSWAVTKAQIISSHQKAQTSQIAGRLKLGMACILHPLVQHLAHRVPPWCIPGEETRITADCLFHMMPLHPTHTPLVHPARAHCPACGQGGDPTPPTLQQCHTACTTPNKCLQISESRIKCTRLSWIKEFA